MQTSDFKKRILNLSDECYNKELVAICDDNDDIVIVFNGSPKRVDDPIVRISSTKTYSFSFNPSNAEHTWIITDDLYRIVLEYASTKIENRGFYESNYDNQMAEIKNKIDEINSKIHLMNDMSKVGQNIVSGLGDDCFVMQPDISNMVEDSIKNQDCTVFNAFNKKRNTALQELEKKRYQRIVDKLFVDMGIIKSKKPRWFD